MNLPQSRSFPASQRCDWCHQSFSNAQSFICGHTLCSNCILKDHKCRSSCPCCWYTNGSHYTFTHKICPACCRYVSRDAVTCSNRHQLCAECSPQACILCRFCEVRLPEKFDYRNAEPGIQNILYMCHVWEKKFEEEQRTPPSFSLPSPWSAGQFNRQDSSMEMEVDPPPVESLKASKTDMKNQTAEDNSECHDCMICLENLGSSHRILDVCRHRFHDDCITQWFQSSGKQSCPTCGHIYGISKGPQPPNGQMSITYLDTILPGFRAEQLNRNEKPTIVITYSIPSGIQGPLNPSPGSRYTGTSRVAYLPNNREGKEILSLLQRAFNDQHVFTIGRSSTTGRDNVVTWNDIHHKTSTHGGADSFGYPDPSYLSRVRQELADKGYR